jgi:hypothetical protein
MPEFKDKLKSLESKIEEIRLILNKRIKEDALKDLDKETLNFSRLLDNLINEYIKANNFLK